MQTATVKVRVTRAMVLSAFRKAFAIQLRAHYSKPESGITDNEVCAWLSGSGSDLAFLELFPS